MIDICATFLLKLQATFIGYGHLWNLQMNREFFLQTFFHGMHPTIAASPN